MLWNTLAVVVGLAADGGPVAVEVRDLFLEPLGLTHELIDGCRQVGAGAPLDLPEGLDALLQLDDWPLEFQDEVHRSSSGRVYLGRDRRDGNTCRSRDIRRG